MVYTRSSKRNALKIIESLDTQNNKLKNKNDILETKNSELEEEVARLKEEKNKLIKKYEPTSTKGAVDIILDLLSICPENLLSYSDDTRLYYDIYSDIYYNIVNNLQLHYEFIFNWWDTNDKSFRRFRPSEKEIETVKNGIIFKKYTEFYNMCTSRKKQYMVDMTKYRNGEKIQQRKIYRIRRLTHSATQYSLINTN